MSPDSNQGGRGRLRVLPRHRGPCGCGARRSFFVAFQDAGTETLGTAIYSRTLPHHRWDGKQLGLRLREGFRGKRLKGTATELANEKKTGATQVPAAEVLEITYPSGDMLKAIETIGPDQGSPPNTEGSVGAWTRSIAFGSSVATDPTPVRWLSAAAAAPNTDMLDCTTLHRESEKTPEGKQR